MHKIIFLDTNIFLHYQPFTQINWLDLIKAESVTIVIPPITIRELTKHKDSHPRAQIKKRAGEIIRKLSGLMDLGTKPKLTEAISINFEDRDPLIDFTAYQLNFSIQDDHLIASILMFMQEAPDKHIVLVTSDLGLALVVKAGRQGINTQKMPDELRIADEPDPNENKVKQLEQQIRELNSRTPDLALVYEDGKNHITIKLPHPISIEKSEIEARVTEIKNKFPKRQKEGASKGGNLPNNTLEMASLLPTMSIQNAISEIEIERYNREIENYYLEYNNFLLSNVHFENQKRRTVRLDIALANGGTAPAEDIDIFLNFPSEIVLVTEYELSEPPITPEPPPEPMTDIQRQIGLITHDPMFNPSLFLDSHDTLPSPPANVSSPKIKRGNSYEVHVHVQKIKHNLVLLLDPLYVIFNDFENAKSFSIDYRILAANTPHEIIGKLHLIVQKDSSN